MKAKYGEELKLCYMGIDGFIVYIKTEDIYLYIAKDPETRFDTSSYELEIAALRPKAYSYLTDDNDENRKAKDTKRSIMKQKLKFEDYT